MAVGQMVQGKGNSYVSRCPGPGRGSGFRRPKSDLSGYGRDAVLVPLHRIRDCGAIEFIDRPGSDRIPLTIPFSANMAPSGRSVRRIRDDNGRGDGFILAAMRPCEALDQEQNALAGCPQNTP